MGEIEYFTSVSTLHHYIPIVFKKNLALLKEFILFIKGKLCHDLTWFEILKFKPISNVSILLLTICL